MISQVQNIDPLACVSPAKNPRASELYTQGSSFHDLFTSAADISPKSTTSDTLGAGIQAKAVSTSTAPAAMSAAAAPATLADSPPAPTFEQNARVTGPDGTSTPLNPMEMASTATAALMAAKLGGTVSADQFAGFATSADIREISFAGSNVKINAGLAATLFANYGDAPGSQAWLTINRDLGRDPMSTATVS